MSPALVTVALRSERDVVTARQRARQIARLLGFQAQDQTRIAIAVSEIARNAVQYARGGTLEFRIDVDGRPQLLEAIVRDAGAGFATDANGLPAGPLTGGLAAARRLMDRLDVETGAAGTSVWLRKRLPRGQPSLTAARLVPLGDALAGERTDDFADEVHQQNRELLQALDELRGRQEDLERLNRELEDTNRGVVALYAELDEKAEHLRRADEMKTRFLSNMSHEFRTPLNSILAIARLLQEHADGPLSSEQDRQVGFVMKAARDLTELVDDLLDLAKVEAGKIVVRRAPFELANLFGALRGMLRPLLLSERVRLVIEDPDPGVPALHSDEGKVAQVLRNLISNALKFTERGEVRVRSEAIEDGRAVALSVADTGIGIEPADQVRIFEEFGQVEHAVQRRVKGTGLGLALSRRLAEVLGGRLSVASTPGVGSVFTLTLPVESPEAAEDDASLLPPGSHLLVIDDDEASRYVVRGLAGQLGLLYEESADGWDGTQRARRERPASIVLDLVMPGLDGREVLHRLRADPVTASVPVVVATSKWLEPGELQELEALSAVVLPKSELSRPDARTRFRDALRRALELAAAAPAPEPRSSRP